jgi:hypothetical protein
MVVFHHSGHVHDKFQIKLRDFLKQKIDNKKLTKTNARDVFEKTERCLGRSLFFPWLAAWRGIFFSFARYWERAYGVDEDRRSTSGPGIE